VLFALSGLVIASYDQLLRSVTPLLLAVINVIVNIRKRGINRVYGYGYGYGYGKRREARPVSIRREAASAGLPRPALVGTLLVVLVLGGLLQSVVFARTYGLRPRWRATEVNVAKIKRELLPAQWNGWEQISFEPVSRPADDPFGKSSLAWTYRQGPRLAKFSVDYPFAVPHDLANCYTAIGWSIADRTTAEDPGQLPLVALELQRQLSGDAFLFFSMHDLQGRTGIEFRKRNRMVNKFIGREDSGPWYQLQLFSTAPQTGSPQEKNELVRMFAEFRAVVIPQIQ
jgi:hypothetical protein